MRDSVSAEWRFISTVFPSLSLCGAVFFLQSFYLFHSLLPAAVLGLVSLFVVAEVVLCANVCVYTTGGSDLSSCFICHPH